jgi:hypothetical protein
MQVQTKKEISGKNISKVVKFQNLVENFVKYGKYSLAIQYKEEFASFVRLYFPHITTFFNQIF